mgnify:CR=1 FL=1
MTIHAVAVKNITRLMSGIVRPVAVICVFIVASVSVKRHSAIPPDK